MDEKILTIRQYLTKGTFVIPNYQRGYKWGVPDKNGKCAVGQLMDDLISAFLKSHNEYFIEAVTVANENGSIILVDGQQRTTTIYLILIALGDFDFLNTVKLDYRVRKDSDLYLKEIIKSCGTNQLDTDIQDIHYFNKALKTINERLTQKSGEDLLKCTRPIKVEKNVKVEKKFIDYLKDNVRLLYNEIPVKKAISNFISLNSLKAKMKNEELIKSDLLINNSSVNFNIYI